MGGPAKAVACIELEGDLVREGASRCKHEYLDGVIYAIQGQPARGLAGGSATHADLIGNAGFALHRELQGTPCCVKMTEMRLRIDAAGAVFYPDVLVHGPQPGSPTTTMKLTEARLVIEVPSPGTLRFDRGDKLTAYQQLAGPQHVVLISGTEEAAWSCHHVPADGGWSELAPWRSGSMLKLEGLAVSIAWDEVFSGVGLAPATGGSPAWLECTSDRREFEAIAARGLQTRRQRRSGARRGHSRQTMRRATHRADDVETGEKARDGPCGQQAGDELAAHGIPGTGDRRKQGPSIDSVQAKAGTGAFQPRRR